MKKTMHALVWHGQGQLRLEERPLPSLLAPEDALVRVTLSSICASDLHIRNGAVPRARPGVVLGHEFVGEVTAVGAGVRKLRPGQRVAANVETFCGTCFFCQQHFINNCERDGWELGCRLDGCQAEYVRVPFADNGLSPIPADISDEAALLVGDVLSSGYFGAELAQIRPGDVVAVLGAGPVGLCAMRCARLFGAGRVLAVDLLEERLDFALAHGFADTAIQAQAHSDEAVVARVLELSHGRGADAVIEAAGGSQTFQTAWKIARPNACVALVALYEEDPVLPLPRMYGKNLIFKTGGVDAVHCERLLQLMADGRLDVRPLLTHRLPLNLILEGYAIFEERRDHCIKCAIYPPEA